MRLLLYACQVNIKDQYRIGGDHYVAGLVFNICISITERGRNIQTDLAALFDQWNTDRPSRDDGIEGSDIIPFIKNASVCKRAFVMNGNHRTGNRCFSRALVGDGIKQPAAMLCGIGDVIGRKVILDGLYL
jgi:hypothetical protein